MAVVGWTGVAEDVVVSAGAATVVVVSTEVEVDDVAGTDVEVVVEDGGAEEAGCETADPSFLDAATVKSMQDS